MKKKKRTTQPRTQRFIALVSAVAASAFVVLLILILGLLL